MAAMRAHSCRRCDRRRRGPGRWRLQSLTPRDPGREPNRQMAFWNCQRTRATFSGEVPFHVAATQRGVPARAGKQQGVMQRAVEAVITARARRAPSQVQNAATGGGSRSWSSVVSFSIRRTKYGLFALYKTAVHQQSFRSRATQKLSGTAPAAQSATTVRTEQLEHGRRHWCARFHRYSWHDQASQPVLSHRLVVRSSAGGITQSLCHLQNMTQ